MDLQSARMTLFVGLIVGMIFALFAAARQSVAIAVVATLIFAAAIIIYAIYYRCPYCGKSLDNVRGPIPKHCPECGKEIEQENY